MMGFWVYILECCDGTFYIGSTTAIERRINEHNSDKHGAKYTARRRPVKLAQAWAVNDWSSALRLERRLKQCSRAQKQRLISGEMSIEAFSETMNIFIIEQYVKPNIE